MSSIAVAAVTKPRRAKSINNTNEKKERPLTPREQRVLKFFGTIPENMDTDPFYSDSNIEHLRKAYADVEAGRVVVHDIIELADDENIEDVLKNENLV
ncbi:MAG: hypothetical protein LBN42_01840 [Oscillospiraceae bacterium]|jgi:hypothetical protein|nr:hypothetical protein [Oscillospiraceae bacterium]